MDDMRFSCSFDKKPVEQIPPVEAPRVKEVKKTDTAGRRELIVDKNDTGWIAEALEQHTIPSEFPSRPDYVWWDKERVEQDNEEDRLHYFYIEEYDKDKYGIMETGHADVRVKGTRYTAKISEIDTPEGVREYEDILWKHYLDALEDMEWKTSLNFGPYSIKSISSGSSRGTMRGYVAVNGDKVKTLEVMHLNSDENYKGAPQVVSCPCTLELSIFESDEISLLDFLGIDYPGL